MLINDPALIERAEIIRQKGTNRNRFLNGEVDKYTLGSTAAPATRLPISWPLCCSLNSKSGRLLS